MAYHQRNNDHYDRNSRRMGNNSGYYSNNNNNRNYSHNGGGGGGRGGRISSRVRSKEEYYNKDLPVYDKMKEIIQTVERNKITLVVGETGSGKTTQIGQYLMDCSFNDGKQVICTQPRQVAATSVARRVSDEQKQHKVGQKIGYQVRLDKKTGPDTKLIFMTEGTLLRIAMSKDENGKSNLNKFSVIIIDEAHERTVNADLLMGFLKTVVQNKDNNKAFQDIDLRLVVMSATLDEKRFLRYFDNPKLVRIPGTLHPIEHFFLHESTQDYIRTTVQCVLDIHDSDEDGDILVFMPGRSEIDLVIRGIEIEERKGRRNHNKHNKQLRTYPLYGQLARERQKDALELNKNPSRQRKCVVSTNIAETSLTIAGIVFVIDCGLSRQKSYDATSGIEALSIQPISKASVKQRQGRAGRVRAGKIYHLYTQNGYANLQNETPAEIVRSSLINEILTMLALGISNPVEFDYIDAPDEMTLGRAITILKHLQCIDNNGNITQIGKDIAALPLNPSMAKSILTAMDEKYNCLNEVLSIAAMVEVVEKLWVAPLDNNRRGGGHNNNNGFGGGFGGGGNENKKIEGVRAARSKFGHVRGDHLTLLNVFFAYMQIRTSSNNDYNKLEDFCRECCLNHKSLERAIDIRQQLERTVYRIALKNDCGKKRKDRNDNDIISFKVNDHSHIEYYNNILKCLLSGHFLNLACLRDKQKYWIFRVCEMDEKTSAIDFVEKAQVDQSSIFSKANKKNLFSPNWVIFDSVCNEANWLKMRTISSIQPLWILETANHYFNLEKLDKDETCVTQAIKELVKNFRQRPAQHRNLPR